MIADELSQDDIDALLGGLGGGDAGGGGGGADDALSLLSGGGGGSSVAAPVAAAAAATPSAEAVQFPKFDAEPPPAETVQQIESLLSDVNLNVKIRLGKTEMPVEDILRLKPGRIIQLDTMSGDPVDLLVNNRVMAKGEVIILNEAFCIRISEIYSTRDKLAQQQ